VLGSSRPWCGHHRTFTFCQPCCDGDSIGPIIISILSQRRPRSWSLSSVMWRGNRRSKGLRSYHCWCYCWQLEMSAIGPDDHGARSRVWGYHNFTLRKSCAESSLHR
jgi:hypothetical protein